MQVNINKQYPSELDAFIGKEMLFKVEITYGNLLHSWRNYAIKRTSDDANLIGRFKTLHNVKVLPTKPYIMYICHSFFNLSYIITILCLIYSHAQMTMVLMINYLQMSRLSVILHH